MFDALNLRMTQPEALELIEKLDLIHGYVAPAAATAMDVGDEDGG